MFINNFRNTDDNKSNFIHNKYNKIKIWSNKINNNVYEQQDNKNIPSAYDYLNFGTLQFFYIQIKCSLHHL